VEGVPSVEPTGLLRTTLKDSTAASPAPLPWESLTMKTLKVLMVSFGPKRSVPRAAM
jgi:hypothetical protein